MNIESFAFRKPALQGIIHSGLVCHRVARGTGNLATARLKTDQQAGAEERQNQNQQTLTGCVNHRTKAPPPLHSAGALKKKVEGE